MIPVPSRRMGFENDLNRLCTFREYYFCLCTTLIHRIVGGAGGGGMVTLPHAKLEVENIPNSLCSICACLSNPLCLTIRSVGGWRHSSPTPLNPKTDTIICSSGYKFISPLILICTNLQTLKRRGWVT